MKAHRACKKMKAYGEQKHEETQARKARKARRHIGQIGHEGT